MMTDHQHVIPLERIACRDQWAKWFVEGSASLADFLLATLHSGAPASPLLVELVERAFLDYQDGRTKDLADAFGVKISQKSRRAVATVVRVNDVRRWVDEFYAQGFKKQDPGSHEDTAFHKAGALLHRSPEHLFNIYYGKE